MRKMFTFKNNRYLYTLMGVLFSGSVLLAENKHTDLTPQVTKALVANGEDSYDVDLDGDDNIDFSIYIVKATNEPVEDMPGTTFTGISIGIEGTTTANQVVIPSSEDFNASELSSGNTVGSSNSFADQALIFLDGTYKTTIGTAPISYGNFDNSTGKFVGVKFISGGNTYYGYIGINTTDNSFTVRGYGYETTKDVTVTIMATTSVSDYIMSNTTIRNIDNTIVADFTNPFSGKMEIVNMNGQVVKAVSVNGATSTVTMDGFSSGIYQVVISGQEGFATKRIFILGR